MTTTTMTRNPAGGLLLLIILAMIVMLAAGVASTVTPRSHAVEKHGEALATHARNCNRNDDVFQVWASGPRKTFAEICHLNDFTIDDAEKTWTIRIIDSVTGHEITVFQHSGDIISLEEYLVRQLYTLL